MANPVTIKFVDFWQSLDIYNNKFTNALKARRDVRVLDSSSSETPDILFYSRCGLGEHYNYPNAVKIFYTGENDYPNFNECDYAISFHDLNMNGRALRYPLYSLYDYSRPLPPISDQEASEREFCSVVMSNSAFCDPLRISIINKVAEYKPVASGGSFRNNVGGGVADKYEFINRFKFNLALENSLLDGYVTEKIADAFYARTVPIYWGGVAAKSDFNPEAFINVEDYATLDTFLEDLKDIDCNPSRYLAMLNAPSKLADSVMDFDTRLEEFLNRIADNLRIFRTNYGEMGHFSQRYSIVHPLSQRNIYIRLSRSLGKLLYPSFYKKLK